MVFDGTTSNDFIHLFVSLITPSNNLFIMMPRAFKKIDPVSEGKRGRFIKTRINKYSYRFV